MVHNTKQFRCLGHSCVQVMKRSIPSLENTATQAALLQRISLDHNLFGSFDEQATQMRQFTNGSNSGLEAGVQAALQLYNGPPVVVNELKGSTETACLPRYSCVANIQPPLAVSDFGVGSKLFGIGMTSRSIWFNLTSNFSMVTRIHFP